MKDESSLDYMSARIDSNGDFYMGDFKIGNIHTEGYLTTNSCVSTLSTDRLYTTKAIDEDCYKKSIEEPIEKHIEPCSKINIPKVNLFKSSKKILNRF